MALKEKIKNVVTSSLFMASIAGVVGGLLLADGNDMYGGIAIGIGIMVFLKAFQNMKP
ncbi:MAG TPA: hypothetical protein QF753_23120 [Victivallales bacterium]|nr:hypothetical protein [Victivallales bacterium]